MNIMLWCVTYTHTHTLARRHARERTMALAPATMSPKGHFRLSVPPHKLGYLFAGVRSRRSNSLYCLNESCHPVFAHVHIQQQVFTSEKKNHGDNMLPHCQSTYEWRLWVHDSGNPMCDQINWRSGRSVMQLKVYVDCMQPSSICWVEQLISGMHMVIIENVHIIQSNSKDVHVASY